MHESVTLYLSPDGSWSNCPDWWKNMINHLEQAGYFHDHAQIRNQVIADYFRRNHHAHYEVHDWELNSPGHVIFPNAESATAFVLPWS